MSLIDVLIVVLVVAMTALGYERGLIASGLPLGGFLVGAAIGARVGPALLSNGSESAYAPLVTLISGLLLGAVLAIAMEGVAFALEQRLVRGAVWRGLDGIGGGALLAALGLALAWVFGAVALHTPGPDMRELRSAIQRSTILAGLNDVLPPSGPLLNVLRRVDPRPQVRGPAANVGRPNSAIARDPDVQRAGDSVVKVLGTACGLGVEGSGWVAGPELVVTNAHVVAGEDDTTVTPRSGEGELDASAVHYDPSNDLAILSVPGLGLPALDFVSGPAPETEAAVLGYPENGPFTISAARIGTTDEVISQDSYGSGPVRREMTSLRGEVRSGNSGGPAVGADGRVLTTVFAAKQNGGPPGGLGVPNEIVGRALAARLGPTGTGPCAA